MSQNLTFAGTPFSAYSVPGTHTSYGGASIQYAADGTSIFMPNTDSFLQLVDNAICAGICSAEITFNWNNAFAGNEIGFCLIDGSRTGASVIITPSIVRFRNETAGSGGSTIAQASIATTGTGKVTFKFEVDLSDGSTTIYKDGASVLTGVYAGPTTGLRIGAQLYHASDNPVQSFDNLITVTTTTAKTITAINGGAGVRVGSTGNTINTLNMGALTALTIGGKAMTNLAGNTFNAPPFVDGQVYALIGNRTAIASDSGGSASRSTQLLPPVGWSVQTLEAPLNTTSGVITGLTPAAQVGEQILIETVNGLITPQGVYQGDVDGTFQVVRIRLDGTVDIYQAHTVEPTTDTTPNSFSFNTPAAAALGATVTSTNTTISGINAAATVSVTGGLVSINGGAFVSSGTITNGQTIAARVAAPNSYSTSATATVNIGGVAAQFTATTIADPGPPPDTTPDSFAFLPSNGAALSTQQTSNTITISGLNTPAAVSVTGGAYSKNGGAFTSSAGSVVNGDTLSVRHTSSALNLTQIVTSLTVGTFSTNFISTTLGNSIMAINLVHHLPLKNSLIAAIGPNATFTRAGGQVYLSDNGEWVLNSVANSPCITSRGVLLEPTRQNFNTNFNANPDAALTGLTSTGGTISRVLDVGGLLGSGLSRVCTSGYVFKFSPGASQQTLSIAGSTGSVNAAALQIFGYATAEGAVVQLTGGKGAVPIPVYDKKAPYVRITSEGIPSIVGTEVLQIVAPANCDVYWVLNQLESGTNTVHTGCTYPIITAGASATRSNTFLSTAATNLPNNEFGLYWEMTLNSVYQEFDNVRLLNAERDASNKVEIRGRGLATKISAGVSASATCGKYTFQKGATTAFLCRVSQSYDTAVFVDGAQPSRTISNRSGLAGTAGAGTISLGKNGGNSEVINGWFRNFKIISQTLSDSDCKKITNTKNPGIKELAVLGHILHDQNRPNKIICLGAFDGTNFKEILTSEDYGETFTTLKTLQYPTVQPALHRDNMGNLYYSAYVTGAWSLVRVSSDLTTQAAVVVFNNGLTVAPLNRYFSYFSWSWGVDYDGKIYTSAYPPSNLTTTDDDGGHVFWVSSDNGLTWAANTTLVTLTPENNHIHSLHVNPWDNRLYISIGDDNAERRTVVSNSELKTWDGVTWTTIVSGTIKPGAGAAFNAAAYCAGATGITFTKEGSFWSSDNVGGASNDMPNFITRTLDNFTGDKVIYAAQDPLKYNPIYSVRARGENELWLTHYHEEFSVDQTRNDRSGAIVRLNKSPGINSQWSNTLVIATEDVNTTGRNYFYLSHDGHGKLPENTDYVFIQTYLRVENKYSSTIRVSVKDMYKEGDIGNTTPAQFSFYPAPLAALGATVTSAPTLITGIDSDAPVSITGGLVSINGGAPVSSGTISNNQTVAAVVTASGTYSTPVTATVDVGGITAQFTVTTIAAPPVAVDTTPDAPTISSVSNAVVGEYSIAGLFTVSGVSPGADIPIVTGEGVRVRIATTTGGALGAPQSGTVQVRLGYDVMVLGLAVSGSINRFLSYGGLLLSFSVSAPTVSGNPYTITPTRIWKIGGGSLAQFPPGSELMRGPNGGVRAIKDPNATLDYGIDFGSSNGGDPIISAQILAEGMTAVQTVLTATFAGFSASGGQVGTRGRVTVRITRASGIKDDRSITFDFVDL